jgi:cytochrome c-type biogenesis protein CcmF
MSWPVITAARGGQGSRVEESLYHLVVVWFFLPLMVLMAITPFVSWRRMEGTALRDRLFGVLCVSFGITGLLHLMLLSTPLGVHPEAGATVAAPFGRHVPLALWMLVLLLSVVFVVVANVWRTVELMRRSAMGTGGFVAHLGLAVLLGGLVLSRGYERKATLQVSAGTPATAMGYTVAYRGTTTRDPFDRDRKVEFDVTTPGGTKFVARPGHYQYKAGEDTKDQVWPAIERFATHDVYLAMGPPQMFVTPEPLRLKPGESQDLGGAIVEYLEPTRKGEFGKPGTQFGAKLRLTTHDDLNVAHQYLAKPTLTLGEGGLTPSLPHFGPDLRVALLGMDASDKSMQVALLFDRPPYPMELYEKPYTGLVWLGTGVLTLGGLISAFARRRVLATRRRTAPTSRSDAPLPTP